MKPFTLMDNDFSLPQLPALCGVTQESTTGAAGRCSRTLRTGSVYKVEYCMSKVTIVHYGFVCAMNKCFKKGFPQANSKVLEDKSTTDHHPVVTTIESGGCQKRLIKLN
jgi:hypothetical protein